MTILLPVKFVSITVQLETKTIKARTEIIFFMCPSPFRESIIPLSNLYANSFMGKMQVFFVFFVSFDVHLSLSGVNPLNHLTIHFLLSEKNTNILIKKVDISSEKVDIVKSAI